MSTYNIINLVTYDDELCPDPLSPAINALCALEATTQVTLTTAVAYRPHAISRAVYGRDDLWPLLFLYCGVAHASELKPGLVLFLPAPHMVDYVISQQPNLVNDENDTVRI